MGTQPLQERDTARPHRLLLRMTAILCFVLYANLFLFHQSGSTASVLQRVGFLALLVVLFWQSVVSGIRSIRLRLLFVGLVVALSGILWRDSSLPLIALHLLTVALFFVFIYELGVSSTGISSLLEAVMLPFSLLHEYIRGMGYGLVFAWNQSADQPKQVAVKKRYPRVVLSILIGVVVGAPAVAILVALFSGADPVFATFVRQVTDGILRWFTGAAWNRFIIRLLLSGITAAMLLPLLFLRKRLFRSPLSSFTTHRLTLELGIALGMVILTLGTFLAVQWQYVFASVPFETDLSRFGVATYSEYVKRGFFELIIASVFIYFGSWAVHIVTRDHPLTGRKWLRWLQLVVLGEFAVLVLSIFRRVYLYQTYHGWSLARLYGSLVLVWITFLCITFVCRLFSKRPWITVELAGTIVLFLFAGWWNAESFIVRTHPPTVNRHVDYVYLSRLSADGTEGWQTSYQYAATILNDASLQHKPLLDREDRRKIAYAGKIVSNLTWNYDHLITMYASPQEKVAYYSTMLFPTLLRRDEPSATLSARLLTEGAASGVQKSKLIESVHLMFWPQDVSFNLYNRESSMYYGVWPSDYAIPSDHSRDMTWWDHLLAWNGSEASAYRYLLTTIDPTQLATLQGSFYRLYDRILTQPSDQRDYDHDLSANSPFVD